MAFSPANAWLEQAESDMRVATILKNKIEADASGFESHFYLYCQIIAKCQQVVEKAIKAIIAELDYRRLVPFTIGFTHTVDPIINRILIAPARHKDSLQPIQATLKNNLPDIRAVMELAPHGRAGAQNPKNTEYPYSNSSNVLIAPASRNAFQWDEVQRYHRTAGLIKKKASELIDVVKVTP